jgi:ferredoxin-NADP reductase
MSSAPELDRDLRITVKRVPGGVVSNWLNDHVRDGCPLEVTPPAGRFVVEDGRREVVALAAGSGITPVFSILRSLLASGTGSAALLYANRDAASVIFGAELDRLAARHRDRFRVEHHLDVERGLVTGETIAGFLAAAADPEVYVCGPGGFIDVVEPALLGMEIDRPRIHVERFSPDEPLVIAEAVPSEITIRTAGRTLAVGHRPGTTLLQTARSAGWRPPSSCETGTCATCMARVVDGEVRMRHNEALSPEEVAGGWVLTCQAEPLTTSVTVVYE